MKWFHYNEDPFTPFGFFPTICIKMHHILLIEQYIACLVYDHNENVSQRLLVKTLELMHRHYIERNLYTCSLLTKMPQIFVMVSRNLFEIELQCKCHRINSA